MASKQLWAPWRLAYIKSNKGLSHRDARPVDWLDGADRDCFLCRVIAEHRATTEEEPTDAADENEARETVDRRNLLVRCEDQSFVVLNRYPYNNGHLLIAPRLHKARLDELTADEHLQIHQQITAFSVLIEQQMNAQGFNIGLNLGSVAGAGLPGHLHWHLVPRWGGDVNFMSVTADVDVIPQSLDALWQLLTCAIEELAD